MRDFHLHSIISDDPIIKIVRTLLSHCDHRSTRFLCGNSTSLISRSDLGSRRILCIAVLWKYFHFSNVVERASVR